MAKVKFDAKIISTNILRYCGGKENIASIAYCMTRLRLTVNDNSLVNKEAIKSIEGVLGLIEQAGQLQIILGPGNVNKVVTEFSALTNMDVGQVDEASLRKEELKIKNSTPFKLFLRKISNIFIPLIPGFVGCGVIYGVAKVLQNLGLIGGNSFNILYLIGKSVFTYMNIMIGMNTAKEFGGSPTLGGAIAGILSAPGLSKIIINNKALVPEAGGVIAVLIACTLGAKLEKRLRKVMPSAIDLMVTPTLVLLIIGVGSLYIFHPLGEFLSNNLTWIVNTLIERGKFVTGAILSATFLPLVMTGLHRALTPVEVSLLKDSGLDLLRPILAMAGAGQIGACVAIYLKTKNKKLKTVIASALPVGLLGVGEPLMFGVTLPLGKPFITACLGSAFGGAYVAMMNVASTGIGLSGLPLMLLIPAGSVIHYIIGTLLAYAGGFLLTYFTKWDDMPDGVESSMDNPLSEIMKI
ncbi:PTS transporter subunit EIIC [Clostridium algidicarnis]|uniref:PTS transporter subunit EIIC n=1 Tax=Clostridium algidicarnis TaxID=37659 RepID=UPI001C0BB674|nr:PTS transporter subunit EIIC [Clostridium algidicarnis]MBU3228020.1 PTS transporter subunit EIIC [Clostridium algidicarnis]MBU3251809.1 PTS transporter subunit EIIC [Clostridium algidicarnis]